MYKYEKKLGSKIYDDILALTLEASVPSSSSEESHCIEVDIPTSIIQALYTWVAKCTAVPESTMNGTLQGAGEILSTTNAITTAPIDSLARIVQSKSNPCHPYLVQVFQDGKVTCDENYLM